MCLDKMYLVSVANDYTKIFLAFIPLIFFELRAYIFNCIYYCGAYPLLNSGITDKCMHRGEYNNKRLSMSRSSNVICPLINLYFLSSFVFNDK